MFRTNLMTRICAVAATAAAGLVAFAAPALAAPTDSSEHATQVSLAPAHTLPGVPESKAYFIRTVRPGGSFADAVLVHNLGATTATLAVAPSDGVTAQLTGAVYATGGVRRDGRWVSVSQSTVTVPAHKTVAVPFSVRVPAGGQAGQHLAGIAFVDAAPAVAKRGALSIRTFYRSVMGVLITVPGQLAPKAAISGVTITPGGFSGLGTANVAFRNTGTLLIRPTLKVLLTRGVYHRQVVKNLNTVLPTDGVNYPVSWPTALAKGTYDVVVSLSAPGMTTVVYRSSIVVGQSLAGGANAPLRPFLRSTPPHQGTVSMALLVGACGATALLAAVGTGWVVVVRRRRRAPAAAAQVDVLDDAVERPSALVR